MENRLEELYDKMIDEAPVEFRDSQKKYILVLARIYATESCQATLEKASNVAKTFKNSNSGSYLDASIDKVSITQESNIVLL